MTPTKRNAYWKANIRLVTILLTVWFIASYGCGILFKEALDSFQIGGYRLGFWFAQQGSIYTFLVLIWIYGWQMDRIDRQHDVHEDVE